MTQVFHFYPRKKKMFPNKNMDRNVHMTFIGGNKNPGIKPNFCQSRVE